MRREKERRQKLLDDAKNFKMQEMLKEKDQEMKQVKELQDAIKSEKISKLNQKKKERFEALKVIKMNELAKEKMQKEHLKEQERENQLVRAYQKAEEEKEQKRAQEFADKEQKIQAIMGRMADTVVKN